MLMWLCFVYLLSFILVYTQVIKGQKATKPPVSLLGQIYWRELFYTIGYGIGGDLEKMETSPICRQIDWLSRDEKVGTWLIVMFRVSFPSMSRLVLSPTHPDCRKHAYFYNRTYPHVFYTIHNI